MSDLIVVVFDKIDDAKNLRAKLRQLEGEGTLGLDDAAVVEKEADGKVHIHDEVDRAVVVGALAGGLLGAVFAFLFPIAGFVIGAGGGALVGKLMDKGVDKKFIQEVTEALKPSTSALFVIVSGGNIEAVVSAMRPSQGALYQTTLSAELENEVRDALK